MNEDLSVWQMRINEVERCFYDWFCVLVGKRSVHIDEVEIEVYFPVGNEVFWMIG
ncbi:hypothetical protein HAPAU_40920 [Halalkalicoccus paucihalophilus]|uniref:Uncharacterized protein n=1 Tax=Halalkalicoccus paucihalophilus TaxID=1008153 RepID=A0A151A8S6_9EURY|nr:hypothetical protein HAPAU_40920 [Halalkalicoccus paucihalophilus]